MSRIRVGIQLASLRLPLKKALPLAARLGADSVELDARNEIRASELTDTGIRHLRKMLEDLNLSVCSVCFPTRRGYQVLDDLDRRIEATKQAMRLAYRLGARVLVNQIGRVPEERSGPEWDVLIDALEDLARAGQREGAVLAAETGSESGAALRGALDAVPHGTIGVSFNPGNLIINGFSPSEALRDLVESVRHVYATDGVRDLARGRGIETQLGRGATDFPELMAVLQQRAYAGPFVVKRDRAEDPLTESSQAVQFLREVAQG